MFPGAVFTNVEVGLLTLSHFGGMDTGKVCDFGEKPGP